MSANKKAATNIVVNGVTLNLQDSNASFYQPIEGLPDPERDEQFKKDYLFIQIYNRKSQNGEDVSQMKDELYRIMDSDRISIHPGFYLFPENVEDLHYAYENVKSEVLEEIERQQIQKIAELYKIVLKYLNPKYF